jgi:phosphate transport system protein
MTTQQPIVGDLRALTASLGVCTELERMGDYAKGIATINLRSKGLSMPYLLREIYSMAEKTIDMLHRSLTSYVGEDVQTARNIIQYDEVIDDCYRKLYSDALNHVIEDPRNIERVNYVIWVAHNLDRMGDRVGNICEKVIYMVTGEYLAESEIPMFKVV